MKGTELLSKEYVEVLNQQKFNINSLDYSILEKHKSILNQLALVGNSAITVFDLYKQKHVFTSSNFNHLFGHDLDTSEKDGYDYFNSRIHSDDLKALAYNNLVLFKFISKLPKKERINFKLINEYRVLNREEKDIRVIDQHQVLELDSSGNMWLILIVIDISPNQEGTDGIKSQLFNYKTGKLYPIVSDDVREHSKTNELTKREKEILQFVKDGFLSKEISNKLSISLHTVNTHRQRILEKLEVNNSLEAVKYASKLGLIK